MKLEMFLRHFYWWTFFEIFHYNVGKWGKRIYQISSLAAFWCSYANDTHIRWKYNFSTISYQSFMFLPTLWRETEPWAWEERGKKIRPSPCLETNWFLEAQQANTRGRGAHDVTLAGSLMCRDWFKVDGKVVDTHQGRCGRHFGRPFKWSYMITCPVKG